MEPNFLINIFAFCVLSLCWLAFAYALFFSRDLLRQTWGAFRGRSLWVQIPLALLTLPLVVGLWVWQTKWPGWLRLALVAGLAWMTEYTFFPAGLF